MTPPSGRARKPIVKVLKERIWPVNGSACGKNSAGKTSAAAVPYRKKSYHSMVVPTVLATTASIRARREEGDFMKPNSAHDFADHTPMNVGQPEIAAAVAVGEAFV